MHCKAQAFAMLTAKPGKTNLRNPERPIQSPEILLPEPHNPTLPELKAHEASRVEDEEEP